MPVLEFNIYDVLVKPFLGLGVRLSPFYILSMVLIAYVIFRFQETDKRFWSWLLPKETYFHKSHMVDIQLFLFGRLVVALTSIGYIAVATFSASMLLNQAPVRTVELSFLMLGFMTVIIAVVSDFTGYWVHRVFHENQPLWAFHAVHHSAEVMTPVTSYRKHPVADFFTTALRAILVGIFQGLVLVAIFGRVDILTLAGANSVYVVFNILGSNLRHSHIWLSYGRIIEHIFISPAQHQIHHSTLPEHINKNYGEIFALWDWMFGTLYIPATRIDLKFGLADPANNSISQPHGSFLKALFVPFAESWQALRKPKTSLKKKIVK